MELARVLTDACVQLDFLREFGRPPLAPASYLEMHKLRPEDDTEHEHEDQAAAARDVEAGSRRKVLVRLVRSFRTEYLEHV